MSIDKISKEIDGVKYELTTFGAKQQARILRKLMQFLSPTLQVLQSNNENAIFAAISELFKNLTEEDQDYLQDTFAKNCKVIQEMTDSKGKTINVPIDLYKVFDEHFANRNFPRFAWLIWCVQANFADFFEGKGVESLTTLFPALLKSTSQTKSIGDSGES